MDIKINTTRHRDVYRPFYTSNNQLVTYMIGLLAPEHGDSCLEPSAGSGCFIDGLLATGKKLTIRAIDLDNAAIATLQAKYAKRKNVEVMQQDFLLSAGGLFDDTAIFNRIIVNPPYGGWQEHKKRHALKRIFPNLYVKETYGLFVVQSLNKLAPNGRAVFILPETFLYLHLQKALRRLLLEQYTIHTIDIFPSNVFPGVNFGYAKLCIISIDNKKPIGNHFTHMRRSTSLDELISGTDGNLQYTTNQLALLRRPEYTFPLHGYSADTWLIDEAPQRLGDIADCVTGIYTGDDGRFLRRSHNNPRGVAKYRAVDVHTIVPKSNFQPTLEGISGEKCFVPILKGGGVPYLKPELWYIDWSIEAVRHYKTDSKTRFQNSAYYFKRGIGFPMVSSGRATASIIQSSWLFDQSVVGIFPKEPELFGFLIAFLNSHTCWRLLRQINPSTNNSAKYLRRLPIVLPTPEQLSWFNDTVSQYLVQLESYHERNTEVEHMLDDSINSLYQQALHDSQATIYQPSPP